MLAAINDKQRQLEVNQGIRCEHLPLHQTKYIINKDGRKVCDECCDHSENATGVYQWNGLTYCWLCCPHRFTEKDFVEDLDGVPTCIMCCIIVPSRSVRKLEYNLGESLYSATRRTKDTSDEGATKLKLKRVLSDARTVKSKGPKLTLTNEIGRLGKVKISDGTDDTVKYDRSLLSNKPKVKPQPPVTTKCEHKNIVMEFMTGDYCCSDCWRRVGKPPAEYEPVKFYPGSRCPRK